METGVRILPKSNKEDICLEYYQNYTFESFRKNRFKNKHSFSAKICGEVRAALDQDQKFFYYQCFNNTVFECNSKQPIKNTFQKACIYLGEKLINKYEGIDSDFRQKHILEYFGKTDVYRCQFCGQILEHSGKTNDLKITADLEHVIPKSIYPQFALNRYNLVPCCLECNQREKSDDFFDDLSEFKKTLKDLEIDLKKRPLELYKKISYSFNDKLEFICNYEENKAVMQLIGFYGLDTRFKKMLGQCFQMLLSLIRIAKINSPESLEMFLEDQANLTFHEYQGVNSFNNSPHIWQNFINEILYDRNKLIALWEEVRDQQIYFYE